MARTKYSRGAGAFKLRSQGSTFKMMGSSPAKKADVEIITHDTETGDIKDIKNIGTGDKALAGGKVVREAKSRAFSTGGEKTVPYETGTAEEIAALEAENQKIAETLTTKVRYSGEDAHHAINEEDWNYDGGTQDKADAHAKVRSGGYYTR